MIKKIVPVVLFLFILTSFTSVVQAAEISIVGNGSDSVSAAAVSSSTNTSVTQENTANITNNVSVNATTGNNEASQNTGNVAINTGNTTVTADVNNLANNSVVDIDCCPAASPTTVKIVGNGASSYNNASINVTSNPLANVVQIADISNQLNFNSNTGSNIASQNSGSVTIETGNIKVLSNTKSKVNESIAKLPIGDPANFSALIYGNGFGSTNIFSINFTNNPQVNVINIASITNVLNSETNTGDNIADKALGDVIIKTGDIDQTINIDNFANFSSVDIDCCPSIIPPVVPPSTGGPNCPNDCPTNSPTPTTTIAQGGPGPSTGGGEILGTSGQILPATGSDWVVTLTIISLLMFLSGLYLCLHPGRDPNPAVVEAN